MQYYDILNLQKMVNDRLKDIKAESTEDNIIEAISDLQKVFNEEVKELSTNKRIILPLAIQQQFYSNWALFQVCPDQGKAYDLCLAISMIRTIEQIDDTIREYYEKKHEGRYKEKILGLNRYFQKASEIYSILNIIGKDDKIKEDLNHPLMKELNKLSKEMPAIYDAASEILNIIFENTNLGSMKASAAALARAEQAYKKLDYATEEREKKKRLKDGEE